MSIEQYLKTLSKEQLEHAVNVAQNLLLEIDNEPRVDVWQVYDETSTTKIFKAQNEAIEHLRKLVDKYERKSPKQAWLFRIDPIELPASEVKKRLNLQR